MTVKRPQAVTDIQTRFLLAEEPDPELEEICDEHGNVVEIRFGSPDECTLTDELMELLSRDPNPSDAS